MFPTNSHLRMPLNTHLKIWYNMDELLELKQDLIEVFRKHSIEISEGSLELETKPYYRQYNNLVVQPMEIAFKRILAYPKKRIDGTYDDIYVDRL